MSEKIAIFVENIVIMESKLNLYNTLSRRKEAFEPINEGRVGMYVCGPTVYNYVHIGNMRPVITFDMVYKYFKYLGYDVTYASNFTDILLVMRGGKSASFL